MPICSRCQQDKEEAEFSSKGRGKLQYFCRFCVNAYNKEYYAQNKARYIEKARRRNAQQRQILKSIIEEAKSRPCTDCGVQYPPWIMDFDHIDGAIKTDNIADMGRWAMSEETLLREIAKCEVVCANCHRQRTYERLLRSKRSCNELQ